MTREELLGNQCVINTTSAREILVARDGVAYGPYTPDQIRQHLTSGAIRNDDPAWTKGRQDWTPLGALLDDLPRAVVDAPPERHEETYYHVAVWKFALLSLVTLGFYPLVWFFQNWQYIRRRDGSKIWPALRSVLGALWVFALARDVRAAAGRRSLWPVVFIGGSYVALNACAWLPVPWDLFSFVGFLPLIFVVSEIDRINRAQGTRGRCYSRFGACSVAATVVGLPVVGFAILASWAPGPLAQTVLRGTELSSARTEFLRREGILRPGENVVLAATGLGSIEKRGSLLTDGRVVSYSRNAGRLIVDSARFADVKCLVVNYSRSLFSDTVVGVQTHADTGFYLRLPSSSGGDRRFVDALKSQTGDVELDPEMLRRARTALATLDEMVRRQAASHGPREAAQGPKPPGGDGPAGGH